MAGTYFQDLKEAIKVQKILYPDSHFEDITAIQENLREVTSKFYKEVDDNFSRRSDEKDRLRYGIELIEGLKWLMLSMDYEHHVFPFGIGMFVWNTMVSISLRIKNQTNADFDLFSYLEDPPVRYNINVSQLELVLAYQNQKKASEDNYTIDHSLDHLPFYNCLTEKGKPLIGYLVKNYANANPEAMWILLKALFELNCLSENPQFLNLNKFHPNILKATFGKIKSRQQLSNKKNEIDFEQSPYKEKLSELIAILKPMIS